MPSAGVLAAIAVGGALGALARWGIGQALPAWDGASLPMATLLANLAGCLAIGVLASLPIVTQGREWLHRFLITGVLGGFTTFSALALEVGVLAGDGHLPLAVAYLAITLIGGLLAVALGRVLVHR